MILEHVDDRRGVNQEERVLRLFRLDVPTRWRVCMSCPMVEIAPRFGVDSVRISNPLTTTWIVTNELQILGTAQAPGRSESLDSDTRYTQVAQEYWPALARIARSDS